MILKTESKPHQANQGQSMTRFVIPESTDSRVVDAQKMVPDFSTIIGHEMFASRITDYLVFAGRKPFAKSWPLGLLEKYLGHPLHLAVMAVAAEDADHLISGIQYSQNDVIRTAIRIIGIRNRYKWVFSTTLLISQTGDRKFTFADCSIIPEPTPEQLCIIACEAAYSHERLTGETPVVAFISVSTEGSFSHYRVDRVIRALELFQKKYAHISAMGEVQVDTAISQKVLAHQNNTKTLYGKANVLIFPNLDAGNTALQLTKQLGRYHSAGSFIHGLEKPVTLLSAHCSTEDILFTLRYALKLEREHANLQLQV